MNTNWWRSKDQLDDDQKAFILLPPHGKHQLEGPPGSGKTNLLLLRAEFMAGQGEKNVLIVTYTKVLADFIRSGISSKGLIRGDQVKTYHSWAAEHILQNLGVKAIPKDTDFDDIARAEVLKLTLEANKKIASSKLYSAIFIDEAQDLSIEEISALTSLSDNICVCGDIRQGLYNRNGLDAATKLGLTKHTLKRHFRIGHKIAAVADRLMPPVKEVDSLENTSNYDLKTQGESRATLTEWPSRQDQFDKMLETIRIQLDAFKDDSIGVFCARRETLQEVAERFKHTDLWNQVCIHGVDVGGNFSEKKPIHLITLHSAKGTEFRVVHIFGAEELSIFPMNRTRLAFTAVTRAKTILDVYRTGQTSVALENAFSKPKIYSLDDLLSGT